MVWSTFWGAHVPISEDTYLRLASEDSDTKWELVCGKLQSKPAMTFEHNDVAFNLAVQLAAQLDRRAFRMRHDSGRLRRSCQSYFIPDISVVPMALACGQQNTRRLEVYTEPLPLVIEVWSPSTGDYEIETKLREDQERGDLEIWRVHPYDRTVTSWIREPNGGYRESLHTQGIVHPAALPGVSIDLDTVFD